MSPSVDLDDDVYDLLKSQAEPFTDTPNTVLRRLLDLGEVDPPVRPPVAAPVPSQTRAKRSKQRSSKAKSNGRTRAASGTLLPEQRYELPLLRALAEAGGEAAYRDVVEAVGRELHDELMPADFETLSSGSVRWQSRIQFVRLRLVERGDMDRDAPRGIWRITDAGRQVLQNGVAS